MVQELQRRWQYHLSEGITDALECRVKVQMSVKGIKIVILIAKTQCVSSPCCGYKPHVFAWCVRTLGFWWGIAHYSCIFYNEFLVLLLLLHTALHLNLRPRTVGSRPAASGELLGVKWWLGHSGGLKQAKFWWKTEPTVDSKVSFLFLREKQAWFLLKS